MNEGVSCQESRPDPGFLRFSGFRLVELSVPKARFY